MIVELQKQDLLNLCRAASSGNTDIKNHKFKHAFEIKPFTNGPIHRFSESWGNTATEEELFDFYKYHSSTIKKL